MSIIDSLRLRVKNLRGNEAPEELLTLIRDLKSCRPDTYFQEAGQILEQGGISIQDSILNRSRVALKHVNNLILTAEDFQADDTEALEKILAEFQYTKEEYESLRDDMNRYSRFAKALTKDASAFDLLSRVDAVYRQFSDRDSRRRDWRHALEREIDGLKLERDDWVQKIEQKRDDIQGLKQRHGALILKLRDLRRPKEDEALNKMQKKAVTHEKGPLLVTAGPGSGKTRVIEERAAHLVSQGCAPESILALTFTVKAAESLKERLAKRLEASGEEPGVYNFHSFCRSIVLKHYQKLGFKKQPTDLEGARLLFFITGNLDKFEDISAGESIAEVPPVILEGGFLERLVKINDLLHNNVADPEIILKSLQEDTSSWHDQIEKGEIKIKPKKKEEEEEERETLRQYLNGVLILRKILFEQGHITYGDQINMALKLIRDEEAVREGILETYRHLMVDEFQDNNKAQGVIVKLLGEHMESVCVVGDMDQAIYGFRGANVRNTEEFRAKYQENPYFKSVVLDTGYRYGKGLMQLTEAYIAAIPERPARDEMKPGVPRGVNTRVELIQALDEISEADALARRIEMLLMAGFEAGDIAVLAYSLNHVSPLMDALEQRNIPYNTTSSESLFRYEGVKDAAFLLRAVLDPLGQELALRYILRMPEFRINELDRLRLVHNAGKKPLLETLYGHGDLPGEIADRRAVERFIEFLKKHERGEDPGSYLDWAYNVLRDAGVTRRLLGLPPGDPAIKAFNNLMKAVEEFATGFAAPDEDPAIKLAEYLEFLQSHDIEDGVEPQNTRHEVYISTIHKAKGLEFPVVFMPQLISRRKQSDLRIMQLAMKLVAPELDPDEEGNAEKNRIFYVGMTRAMDRLYLSRPEYTHDDKGELKLREASPHLCMLEEAAPTPMLKTVVVDAVPQFAGRQLLPLEERFRQLRLRLSYCLGQLDESNVADDLRNTIKLLVEMKVALASSKGAELGNDAMDLIEGLEQLVGGIALPEKPLNLWEKMSKPGTTVAGFNKWLSFSAIREYQECPLKFRLSRIERLVTPMSSFVVTGSNIHRVIEIFTERHHPEGTLEQLMEIFEEVWAEARYESDAVAEIQRKAGCDIVEKWYEREMARTERPQEVEVEKKFSFRMLDMEIIGFIDRVEKFKDGRWELVDFKTGKEKRPTQQNVAQQLALYYLGCKENWGVEAADLVIENLTVGNRLALGGVTPSFIAKYKTMTEAALVSIKEGKFEATPGYWACMYCNYGSVCDERE